MRNFIGGLFKRQPDADLAYETLRKAGFEAEAISMLARKPKNAPVNLDRVQAPEVAKGAVLGAILLAILGAGLGLLAGLGVIPIPGVDAATYRISTAFVLSSVVAGLLAGGVTGAILGTATRLLISKDKVEITSKGIRRGGLLVVARVEDAQSEASARRILQESGAVDLQNLSDKWDLSIWSEFSEVPHPGSG